VKKSVRLPSRVSASFFALMIGMLGASCSSTPDTADVIPPLPGAVQPDGGGSLVDEDTACAALVKAEADARSKLGCDAVKRTCPGFIRPAGGEGCFVYDQASIDSCRTIYAGLTSCDAFDQRPCLLTAESKCDEGAGGAGGQGGAAGAGGIPGASGAGGASGASAGGTAGANESGAAGANEGGAAN